MYTVYYWSNTAEGPGWQYYRDYQTARAAHDACNRLRQRYPQVKYVNNTTHREEVWEV